jgi:hypothetical protein
MADEREVTGSARATLDAWRARGADRVNPLRFHFIEALERRAAGHSGAAQRILDDRLNSLLSAYAEDLEKAAFTGAADSAATLAPPERGALGELLDHIAGRAPAPVAAVAADRPAAPRRYGRLAGRNPRCSNISGKSGRGSVRKDSCGSRSNKCPAMPVRSTRAVSCIGLSR